MKSGPQVVNCPVIVAFVVALLDSVDVTLLEEVLAEEIDNL